MIKRATTDDLEQIYQMLIKAQDNPQMYSGFMSENPTRLKEDLMDLIINKRVLMDSDHEIKGVLTFSPQFKDKIFDVAGPFVLAEDVFIAFELCQVLIHELTPGSQLNFFFRKESRFYRQLMALLGAIHQSDEYILSLHKNRFQSSGHLDIKIAQAEDFDAIQQLHDEIFPKAYIPGKKIIVPSDSTVLYVLKEEDIVGYAYLKQYQGIMMLEVFALALKYRNQKKSVPFLKSILHHIFQTRAVDEVRLVVEELNEVATHIYKQCGFQIYYENSAYQLNTSL